MATRNFSIGEAISFGWKTTWGNLGFFIVLTIIVLLAEGIPSGIARVFQQSSPGLYALFEILAFVIEVFVGIGVIRIALKFVERQPATYDDLFSGGPLFVNYLVTSVLLGIIITIGLILFVIPGIYLALRFQFAPFLVVDQGLGPFAALSKSSELTRGVKWKLLGFDILLGLIEFVGLLVLLLGLLVAIPTVLLAITYVYRQLLSQTGTGVAVGQTI